VGSWALKPERGELALSVFSPVGEDDLGDTLGADSLRFSKPALHSPGRYDFSLWRGA
jgi:hypothetical protein